MLEKVLAKSKRKTLKFKKNTHSLQKIIQTVITFANTTGRTLLIR